jgi:hypothetical protein
MLTDKVITDYSNPQKAQKAAFKYLGNNGKLFLSTRKNKKYMIRDKNDKWVHFGQMGYEDFTKHQDDERRKKYLKRSMNIRGNWKENPYSPNNLSINILW